MTEPILELLTAVMPLQRKNADRISPVRAGNEVFMVLQPHEGDGTPRVAHVIYQDPTWYLGTGKLGETLLELSDYEDAKSYLKWSMQEAIDPDFAKYNDPNSILLDF